MGSLTSPVLLTALLCCGTALAQEAGNLKLSRSLNIKPTPSTPALTRAQREAIDKSLPAAPEGLTWALYKNAVFLRPEKWYENEKSGSIGNIPTAAWAASPEAFSAGKPFETGITIQILRGPRKMREIEPAKMAMAYIKPFFDSHKREDILNFEQSKAGNIDLTSFRFRDAAPGLKPVIVHKLLLADNTRDTVHIFTFESPVDTWEANWAKVGAPFIQRAVVRPEIPPN